MTDALLSFISYPLAVETHVLGEALGTLPVRLLRVAAPGLRAACP